MIKTKFSRYVSMLLALIMALSINVFASSETITFIVTGDSIHNEGEHTSYQEWINTTYTLNGENIGEIMENVLTANGYTYDYSIGTYGGYLNSITTPNGETLGSYTNGSKSGWMNSVNGVMPDYSMDQVYPQNGDVVEIFYIDDYEAEIYGYYSTITVTPSEATLVVKNTETNEIIEPSWGSYSFFNGSYNYTASANGYVTKSEDFVVSGAGVFIDVTLQAENNTTEETTEETTTEETTYTNNIGQWGLFRKNINNNGVITSDTPTPNNAEIKWATSVKSGWDANSGSVITDNYIYTVVGSGIIKIDKNTGEILKTSPLDKSISYTYFLAYGNGKVFIQLSNGEIEAVDSDTLEKLWTSAPPENTTSGTGVTPIYYNNGKVYAGTYSSAKNDSGYYYCLNADNGEYIWTLKGGIGDYAGFYWSGCVAVDNNIVVGGEDGKLLMIDSNGTIIDTFTANAGIRSTIVYENNSLYFTDKSGYIYSLEVTANGFGTANSTLINANATGSTSTPAIYNNKIYVGTSSGWGSPAYFCVLDTDLNVLETHEVEGSVQSSPLVAVNGDNVRVYFTCNSEKGNLKYYENGTCQDLIDLKDYEQYCIHSIIADNDGTIYYQNDSGYIVAITKGKETTSETTESTTEIITEITTEETTNTATEVTTETTSESTTKPSTSSGSGSSGSSKITVSFSLSGDGISLTDSNVTVNANSTVATLIKKVFADNNVTCVGLDKGYISSVTYNGVTLSEFDHGENSGWMFTVNGEYPTVSINNYNLSSGDSVTLTYVDDYTKVSYSNSDWDTDETTASTIEATTEITTTALDTTVAENNEKTEIVVDGETLSHSFSDMKSTHWANEAVTVLYNKDIIKGKTATTFEPNSPVTRAELVSMLYRLSEDNSQYNCDFVDVNTNAWYYNAVAWAYNKGIVYGINENEFSPNTSLTRQDMACIVTRYAEAYNISLDNETEYKNFVDNEKISAYAEESIKILYCANIVHGNDKGEFEPTKNLTRAETAVIIYNLIK